ncbi:uncharacterized protein K489DRAFT_369807 [Dissoconium aciculare CBS 342.82]|uniref:Secreted protein n=1 Tax=Dissoconium aciculare CBS 342.82 TaxID=1314786 RepID=A0A6J3M7D3_9PEZI|nr:uncharacterized protein K489DRAFT_369807 [Dissoconium aciculare CBS 342.82]KAF1823449.1 hypothetical protein K489DRAFT_369807 [Dissoconium aciculare CBS 342.82]
MFAALSDLICHVLYLSLCFMRPVLGSKELENGKPHFRPGWCTTFNRFENKLRATHKWSFTGDTSGIENMHILVACLLVGPPTTLADLDDVRTLQRRSVLQYAPTACEAA